MNHKALMRDPISIADVVASRWIAEPLHLLDCCLVTDGGGAVLIVSEERSRDLARPPVWILSPGEAHTQLGLARMPDLPTTPPAITGPPPFAITSAPPAHITVVY